MLDLNKLSLQIQQAGFDMASHQGVLRERLKLAHETWSAACRGEVALVEKLLRSRSGLAWNVARPLEALDTVVPLPPEPPVHTVIASDGSQIAPSRHEISPCYLINISRICYRYGTGVRALQESEPYLYYREQDLYTQHQHQQLSVSEAMIGLERSLLELHELANLAEGLHDDPVPALALVDGSLYGLLPELANLPGQIQERARDRLLTTLERLRQAGIPVCAYTSLPRRQECLQLLRLQRCPFATARCDENCPPGASEPPCAGVSPLPDRALWQQLLAAGERSPLFTTTAGWPSGFGEGWLGHELCFVYLHTGYEIARLEFPRWVADRPEWLAWVHAVSWLQVQKGRGYPIALAEAHNQAVIKAPDRAQFYAMLSRRLAGNGNGVALSYKELKKRKGLV